VKKQSPFTASANHMHFNWLFINRHKRPPLAIEAHEPVSILEKIVVLRVKNKPHIDCNACAFNTQVHGTGANTW
jgi:hypothetical protein